MAFSPLMLLSPALLPPRIAAAREALAWPATRDSHAPLFYQPLSVLPRSRVANEQPLRHPAFTALAEDVQAAIDSLGGSDFARVAVGLLLLGGGGVDECHALITPLCWPDGTTFGLSLIHI